jgi:ABC-type glycerol-3-phosphate transport system permease component
VAAVLTGVFSAADAASSFGVLFFGGIAVGAIIGYGLRCGMSRLRRAGMVGTTTHVLYEVCTPFVLFLLAEEIHVSGILAVVAAGLVMQEHEGNIKSPERARQQMVSNSFWEVIIFVINGFLFVMLGMQLPKVMEADTIENLSSVTVIGAVLAVTLSIIVVRFLGVAVLDVIYADMVARRKGAGAESTGTILKQALVTTLAGPKGAVTLSIILTLPIVAGQMVVACLASYSFARYRRKRREVLFFSYIILMLMPFQVTLVPNYMIADGLGILDTVWAIILPGIFSTFAIFLLTKYMRQIPSGYIEAATLDGASEWQIFTNIALPLCKNAIFALTILLFIDYWNMVEQPLVLMANAKDLQPMSVFLSQINEAEIGIAFAASSLFMIPPLLIFLWGEEYLVEGISRSGVK